jgi:hypothetical protein
MSQKLHWVLSVRKAFTHDYVAMFLLLQSRRQLKEWLCGSESTRPGVGHWWLWGQQGLHLRADQMLLLQLWVYPSLNVSGVSRWEHNVTQYDNWQAQIGIRNSETYVDQYLPYTMPSVCLSDWVTPSSPWSQWKFVCEWCHSPGLTEDLLFMVMTFPWLPFVIESNTQVGRVKIKLREWQHNLGFHPYGVWLVCTRVSMVTRSLWLQ